MVDRGSELANLVRDGGVVGAHRRLERLRVDTEEEPLVTAEHREAAPALRGRVDGGVPVRFDAELLGADREPVAAGGERERHALQPVRPALEPGDRLLRRQAADGDAGDRDPAREPLGRPREREA